MKVNLQIFGGRGGSFNAGGGNYEGTATKEEMLEKLNKLRNFGNKDKSTGKPFGKANPLMANADDDALTAVDRINFNMDPADREKGKTELVDMDKVATTQPWVVTSAMVNSIENPTAHSYTTETPVGIRYDGKVYLVDGNHRAVKAYLRGDTKLKVRIIGE